MKTMRLDPDKHWEVAYEVCFYRDLFKSYTVTDKENDFSDQRTFDLWLFFENLIVIIEAKAHGDFDRKQLDDFENNKQDVPKAIKSAMEIDADINVYVLGLASSQYFDKATEVFNGHFSWKDIYDSFSSKNVFLRADDLY